MANLPLIVQSVVGIAAVGVKLSKTLFQVGHRAALPEHNVHRIAASVSALSLTLRLLASILQAPRSLHSPASLRSLDQLLKDTGAVFQDCTNLVIHARDKTETIHEPVPANGRRRRQSVVARVKWCFEQPYVQVILAELEYLHATFNALVKTFDIALTSSRLARSGKPAAEMDDEMNHEKLHLETIVIAQQMTVTVMQEVKDKCSASYVDSIVDDLPEHQGAAEQRYAKLLTRNSDSSIQPIRLCDESFEFLDQRPSGPRDEDSALAPTDSRSAKIVDGLIREWTSPIVDAVHVPARNGETDGLDESDEENAPRRLIRRRQDQLHQSPGLQPIPSEGLPNQWTRPEHLVPGVGRSLRPLQTDLGQPQTSHTAGVSRPGTRSEQVESVVLPHIAAPPALPQSSVTTPVQIAIRIAGSQSKDAPFSRSPVVDNSNYRHPHVGSGSSSDGSSDSGDGERSQGAQQRASASSKHSYHDSGIGDGLGIPWRIRISPGKYFDFRDEKLVGPRTPYLPSESRQWIYSHDNAVTEISKKWVSMEAVLEKRYAHTDLRGEQSGDAVGGVEGAWRILQALRFAEIEALVSRTIAMFRQRSTTHAAAPWRQPAPAPPRSPQPYTRTQISQTQQPQPLQVPPQLRGVSFNEGPPRRSVPENRPPRTPTGTGLGPGPGSQGHFPLTNTPGSPATTFYSRAQVHPHQEWRDGFRDIPLGLRRERNSHERNREREPDRDRDRDRDRERPMSRSGKNRHRYYDRNREREREREMDGDKSMEDGKKKSRVPSTLAKVGGIWALLEGLDGI